jgi:hypothetical protein
MTVGSYLVTIDDTEHEVEAETPFSAVVTVLNRLHLNYSNTKFKVQANGLCDNHHVQPQD